jgi:RNA polymerase sigma-70 factor (ECF subfamily)
MSPVSAVAPAPPPAPLAGTDDPLAALATRARRGDDAAFTELVRATSDRLFQFLYRLSGHAQDAEDLAQETYLKAYRALDRYDPRRPFLPWLFTIARRSLLNHRRAARPCEPLPEELPARPSAGPDANSADGDALEHLWRVARGLHPRYHHVLWLYYGEGFDTRQVAAVLKTRPLVVKVLLHRARRALLAALRRHRPDLLP